MRDIKFKAVDEKTHKIYDVAGINFVEDAVLVWVKTGSVRATKWMTGLTLIQYIGIKDKHSVEIYASDAIKLDNRAIGGSVTFGEVMFNTDQTLSRLEWGLWTKNGYYPTDFLGDIEILKLEDK